MMRCQGQPRKALNPGSRSDFSPSLGFGTMQIEITPKKSPASSAFSRCPCRSRRCRTPRRRPRAATRRPVRLPGFRPGKAPAGDGREEVQGRDPPAGARDARPGGVQGSDRAREAQGRLAAARARPQVRGGQAAHLRAAPRGASRDRARAHAGLPRHAPQTPRSPTSSVREQIEQMRDQKATWAPVEEKPRRATWCTCSSRRPKKTARSPKRKRVSARARRRPGDRRRRGADHGAHAGRDRRAAGAMAGRFPRRSAARQDEDRARHAAGREAQGAAGARRRVRARGRRLRVARRAARPRCARISRSTPSARPTRTCGSSSIDQIVGANPFDVPPSWVKQLIDALHAGVPDSGGAARAVRDGVPPDGRASGAARSGHRDDRRAARS